MENINSDKIVVSVGVGSTQLPFIKALKDRGYQVAGFGKGRNDFEAISICDYFSEIDTSSYEEAINWLTHLPGEIVAAGSYAGGVAIQTLQEITRHFKLPTKIPNSLSTGMDKFEQQKLYENFYLSTIRTYKYSKVRENPSIINGINKFIIKPSIGRGSEGVYKVDRTGLEEKLANDVFNEDYMIQELRDGTEYRTLIIIQEYELKLLAPIKRDSFHGSFLLGRLSYKSDDIEVIRDYVVNMITNLKLKDGIVKADLIVNVGQVDMIEMDIGVGGGVYYKEFISHVFNYDITNEYINLITGNKVRTAVYNDGTLVMDYIYNLKGYPVAYNLENCKKKLIKLLGEELTLIPNLLRPERSGNFSSNSDFIFCLIHNNADLLNYELNEIINSEVFAKKEDKGEN